MIVKDFEIKKIYTARHQFETKQLIINGTVISSNFGYYELDENFLQIDICDECMTVGCSSGGYVQIIEIENYIIWKTPLTDGMDDYHVCQFTVSSGLRQGLIFWTYEQYEKLLNHFEQDLFLHSQEIKKGFSKEQAKHMWRIYASKCLTPNTSDVYPFDKIEENFLSFYSDCYESKDNIEFYREIKQEWEKAESLKLVKIPENSNKVVVIFDTVKGYSEWDFIWFDKGKYYFPIGDGLGITFE